jgi:hypothetical protein
LHSRGGPSTSLSCTSSNPIAAERQGFSRSELWLIQAGDLLFTDTWLDRLFQTFPATQREREWHPGSPHNRCFLGLQDNQKGLATTQQTWRKGLRAQRLVHLNAPGAIKHQLTTTINLVVWIGKERFKFRFGLSRL